MKKIIALLLVLALAVSTAACGANNNETTQTTQPQQTITFWSRWQETDPQAAVIQEAAAVYEENTGIKVAVQWKGGEAGQALADALADKQAIDIIEEDYQLLATELLPYTTDLTEMAKAAGYKGYECLNNQVIAWAGHLNAIPEQPQVGGVFYNQDAFSAAEAAVPGTWMEFMDVCSRMKALGITPLALDQENADFLFYHALLAYMDEAAIREAAVNGGWSATAAVQAAQDAIDLVSAGYLAEGAPHQYPDGQNQIGSSEAAMVVGGQKVTTEVNDAVGYMLNWGLFAYPGSSAVYTSAISLAVTADSQQKQEAFDFIMLLTTGEFDQKMADTAGQIPADPDNMAPMHLTGTVELLKGAQKAMSWCGALRENEALSGSIQSLIVELYQGRFASGEAFCAALDALY